MGYDEKESYSGKALVARAIIQMMGAPKEHVEKTLADYISSLKKNKGMKVISEDTSEAEETEEKMFSVFSELEISFASPDLLISFCIEAMPSSIEILEPDPLKITASELTGVLNDLQGKLHKVDMSLKELRSRREVMSSNMDNLFVNFVRHLLGHGPLTKEQLSEVMGIKPENLEKYMESLIQRKIINKDSSEKGRYSLPKA